MFVLLCLGACGGGSSTSSNVPEASEPEINAVPVDGNPDPLFPSDGIATATPQIDDNITISGPSIVQSAPLRSNAGVFLGIFDTDGVTQIISGETQSEADAGQIDVLAWHWNSTTGNRSVCSDGIAVTKFIDLASAQLLVAQLEGRSLPVGKLMVRRMGGDTPLDYLMLEFSNFQVEMIETGGSTNDDRLLEVVHFSFDTLNYTYLPQERDGTAGTPVTASGERFTFGC